MYVQIIIAIIFSYKDVSNNVKNYFKWMQIYKLDFSIINKITMLNETPLWIHSNNINFVDIQMYWSGFIINFFYLLLILILLFIIWRISIILKGKLKNSKILNLVDSNCSSLFSKSLMWWSLNKLFFIFPFWWISTDLINFYSNFLISFSSMIVVLLIITVIIYSRFGWFQSNILASEKEKYDAKFECLNIARNLVVATLFLLNSSNESDIFKIVFWSIQLTIITYVIVSKDRTETK